MKINLYVIEKNSLDEYAFIQKQFEKKIASFAKIQTHFLFDNKIAKAQNNSNGELAQKEYSRAFATHLGKGYSVALDPSSKELDTFQFSELFQDKLEISFFIGGAYGLEKNFLCQCDKAISLSSLTMSHKIAKVVLYEQIYRALSIINNHPYHK